MDPALMLLKQAREIRCGERGEEFDPISSMEDFSLNQPTKVRTLRDLIILTRIRWRREPLPQRRATVWVQKGLQKPT